MPNLRPGFNVRDYNRYAWDRQVDIKNKFTVPVTPEEITCRSKRRIFGPAHRDKIRSS